MKFQLFLLISCLVVLSQSIRRPKPENNWRPEDEENWRPEPENNWRPQPVPKPENPCNCLPKAEDVEFTPIVEIEITHDTKLNCEAKSKFISILDTLTGLGRVTCNGVVVDTSDTTFTVVSPYSDGHGGHGGKNTDTIVLKNYTRIITYNNGNVEFQECGVIVGGKCSGDILTGTGILEANDQKGCCKGGITGETGLERQIDIKGKCASCCKLDHSTWAFAEPVNNYGIVDRTIAAKTHE